MLKNPYLLAGAAILVAALVALLVLSGTEPAPVPESPAAGVSAPADRPRPAARPALGEGFAANTRMGPRETGREAPRAPTATATEGEEVVIVLPEDDPAKAATLANINEAMSTYSAAGVPVLQPLLTSRDPDIREEAIDAMSQLGVPEAAAALRQAARQASNPRERAELLEAAEFAESPSMLETHGWRPGR
jgi:hypothetical protein